METHKKILEVIQKIYKSTEEIKHSSFEIQRLLLPYFKNPEQLKEDELTRAALLTVYMTDVNNHTARLGKLLKDLDYLLK